MSRRTARRQRFYAEQRWWRHMLATGMAIEIVLPLRSGYYSIEAK